MRIRFHFFKKRDNSINVENVIKFFNLHEGFKTIFKQDEVIFKYYNVDLDNKCTYKITYKSQVPNIHKLDASFHNLNFFVDFDILISEFLVKDIYDTILNMSKIFDMYIYHESFSNAVRYNEELLINTWKELRNKVITDQYNEVNLLKENVLKDITSFQKEYSNIKDYYLSKGIDVNPYIFYKGDDQKLYFAMEWTDLNPTIFPPYLDYIIIKLNDDQFFMTYSDVYSQIKGILSKIPNYITGANIIKPKHSIKLRKIFKIKHRRHHSKFKEISLSKIIEY